MTVRIAVAGIGVIGIRHVAALAQAEGAHLACVIDPADAAAAVAARHGVPHHRTLEEMLAAGGVEGVVLATPNPAHVAGALACIDAGLPCLVEKPLATDLAGAEAIVAAAAKAGVPVAVGHHRRHSPLVVKAREIVTRGDLGRITAIQSTTWFYKPEAYFDIPWRREKGAGPVYLNLIHDIDLLRHLAGEITSVHAMESNAVRGHAVEETTVILLRFASGALGTMNVCDAAVAPLSWEMTARENPAFPATGETCYWLAGTGGSLALPNLSVWSYPGPPDWMTPIARTRIPHGLDDPLVCQLRQFADVIRGEARPLVPATEGLANQRVIEAIKTSAATGRTVVLSPPDPASTEESKTA